MWKSWLRIAFSTQNICYLFHSMDRLSHSSVCYSNVADNYQYPFFLKSAQTATALVKLESLKLDGNLYRAQKESLAIGFVYLRIFNWNCHQLQFEIWTLDSEALQTLTARSVQMAKKDTGKKSINDVLEGKFLIWKAAWLAGCLPLSVMNNQFTVIDRLLLGGC